MGTFLTDVDDAGILDGILGTFNGDGALCAPGNLATQLLGLGRVALPDGTMPLLGDVLADLKIQVGNNKIGVKTVAQLAALSPTTPDGILVDVTKDPADVGGNINGTYQRDAATPAAPPVPAGWFKTANSLSVVKATAETALGQANVASGAIADISAGLLQLPQRANFAAKTGYAQTWVTIGSPETRWTITETDGSYKIDTLGTAPQPWPIGVKMPYDLVPGDAIEVEYRIAAGTIDSTIGPFFGTDPATVGDISTNAIMYHWRNAAGGAGIYGQNYTGTGGILPGYATVPQVTVDAPFVPFVLNDTLKIKAQVLGDRSLTLELFVNGSSKLKLVAPGILPVGRVIAGIVMPVTGSATVTSVKRIGFNGTVVHIDSSVAISGNGTLFAPVKTWDEAVAIGRANRFSTLDVKILSEELRGAIVADDRVFARYRVRGRGGSQTRLISADKNPTDWTLLGGTTKVWTRLNKNAAGAANTSNSGAVYLTGVQITPKPWYTLPDTILPYFALPGSVPADLEGQGATGGRRVSGGVLYVRIPDALGTTPAATPMEVNNSVATLYCIGSPQIECDNIVFSRGGIFNVYLDRATAVFRHCGFEWSESNGTEDAAGNAYYIDCWWDAAANDLAARTFPADYADTLSAPPVSVYINPRMRRTIAGDGISNHGSSVALRAKMIVINPDITDCAKDGIVPASCDFWISGGRIARCANAQIEIIGGANAPAVTGMFAAGVIEGVELDPAGVGLYGYLSSGYAGGKSTVAARRVHIRTPVNGELWGGVVPVSGRPSVPADFTTTFTNCTTERPVGTRVENPNGVVTFTKLPTNAL
jgi:hypothetical protein